MKSMTGYGRAQLTLEGRDITVEIKSVNHRFFEFSARFPRAFGYLEEKLKSAVSAKISRGKVDVSLQLTSTEGSMQVEINSQLAAGYLEGLRSLGRDLGLADDISLSKLARFNDIFLVRKCEEDEDEIWDSVRQVLDLALEKFIEMREAEGQRLRDDILTRLKTIEECVAQVEMLAPKTAEAYRAKLTAKMTEILAEKQLDESRIITEAAIFSEKIAVDEETVRLRSHIGQLRLFLTQEQAVGRKLDFLVQELNRETNTIGSKAQDIEISKLVVEMKSEIEKIREQIQNIE